MAPAARADLPRAPWQWEQSGPPDAAFHGLSDQGLTIDSQTPIILPNHGTNSGMPFALTCGPDELVTGIWGRAGISIDMVGIYCARMRPNGMLFAPEQRTSAGTSTNEPFSMQCPQHQAVITLRGRAAIKVDRLGLGCARVRPWVDRGIRGAVLDSIGGPSGTPFSDECPRGYLLQGILGYSNGSVNSLQGLCAPIVTGR